MFEDNALRFDPRSGGPSKRVAKNVRKPTTTRPFAPACSREKRLGPDARRRRRRVRETTNANVGHGAIADFVYQLAGGPRHVSLRY